MRTMGNKGEESSPLNMTTLVPHSRTSIIMHVLLKLFGPYGIAHSQQLVAAQMHFDLTL